MNRFLVRLLLSLMLASSPAFAGGTLTLVGVGSATNIPPTPPTLTYCGTATDATVGLTITFATAAACTAGATRILYVAASSCAAQSGVTINGGAATNLVLSPSFSNAGIYALAVPAGTTASIAVTRTSSCSGMGIGVWAGYNVASITPVVTTTTESGVATSNVLAFGSTAGAGFLITAITTTGGGSVKTFTSTNATERYDSNLGGGVFASMSGNDAATTGAAVNVTYGISTAPTTGSAVGISFQ